MGECNLEIDVILREALSVEDLIGRLADRFPEITLGEAFCIDGMSYESKKNLDVKNLCEVNNCFIDGKTVFICGKYNAKSCGIIACRREALFEYDIWLKCDTADNEYGLPIDASDSDVYDLAALSVSEIFGDTALFFAAIGCEMFIGSEDCIRDIIGNSAGVERWVFPSKDAEDLPTAFSAKEVGRFTVFEIEKNAEERFKRYK